MAGVMKPKKLYRYELANLDDRLRKHSTEPNCNPQLVERSPDGEMYRCRHGSSDFYGWTKRAAAKHEFLRSVRREMTRLTGILTKYVPKPGAP